MIELWFLILFAPGFAFWMCGQFMVGGGLFAVGALALVFPPAVLLQWYFALYFLAEITKSRAAREAAVHDHTH